MPINEELFTLGLIFSSLFWHLDCCALWFPSEGLFIQVSIRPFILTYGGVDCSQATVHVNSNLVLHLSQDMDRRTI